VARSEAAREMGVLSPSSVTAAEPVVQAEAWLAWLVAGCVAVFLTSNPFYLATACLAGLVAYESLPGGQRRRAYGLIVKIGLFFALLSIPFNVLTGSSGSTALVDLPRLSFPGWLGGVTLGGQVTAEAALYAAGRALRLVALLLFATGFNVGVDHYRLLRLVPPALKQLGVVATVAVLLLPQSFTQARAVAEAQRLRGRRLRGLRDAAAFAAPVLAGALERSISRAESLDARGFGSAPRGDATGVWAKALVMLAAGLAGAGVCLYLHRGENALPALALMVGAGVAAMLAVRTRGGGVEATRYSREPLARSSAVIIACSAAALMLLLALRVAGAGGIAYYPYPTAMTPELNPIAVLAFLLFLAPVPYAATSRALREPGDD
jgi:energy-coupling factor transport system permease protein